MGEFLRRVTYLLNRRRLDRELDEEMAFHREMAARAGAERKSFGNAMLLREQAREAWGWTWIDRLGQDLRYAFRTLRGSPGFTAAAVLVLAVGIGVNVAAFGLFSMFVLKPLPVRDPDTLVRLQRSAPGAFSSTIAYPSIVFYRDHAKTLSAVLASTDRDLALEDESKPVRARFVTANFFSELGGETSQGRLFEAGLDERADAAPIVVLSHSFWEQRFNSDPSVIGRVVHLNHRPATVVGVAPRNFSGLGLPHEPAFWVPITQQPYFLEGSTVLTDATTGGMVDMWARLAKRVTPRMAEQELGVLTDELRKRSPAAVWDKERIISEPGGYLQVLHNDTLPMVGLVTALVLLILAVACSNLGGLLLARGVTRAHEISIRVALGASRWRVVRQLFTESLLLAAIAAVAGLGLGYTCLRTFMAQFDAAPWLDPMPDWREIAFAAVVGLLAAIFFGLAPAMQLTGKRRQSIRARQVLVMAQIAASCILLIVAGLLVRALNHALSTDPGYDYRHTLVIDPDLAAHGYTASGSQHYLDAVQQKLRELPGLASVGVSSMAPLGHKNVTGISGHSYNIFVSRIEPGFFETMQIPRQSGRDVSRTDTNEIVASESMAQHEWPGQNPLGKQFVVEPTNPASERLTVVGVVANARTMSMHDPDSVEMYQMARPQDLAHMVVLVRTAGAPEDIAAMARGVASSIDPALFPNVRLLRDSFHDEVGTVERGAVIAGLMGTTAMLLAVVGIVGLVAYAVSQKTQEIAIRLALGAGKRHVVTTMLRQFFVPVALGLVVGAALSAAVSHLLRRILYGVSGLDPASYAGAIGLLATMATIAALWPARRAVRIDPMRVLRHE